MKQLLRIILVWGLFFLNPLMIANSAEVEVGQQAPEAGTAVGAEALEERVAPGFIDERVLLIESEAQEKILALVDEINQLANKSHEPELQKEIERIKLDAEIARFRVEKEIAEDEENFDLAQKIQDEIDHLENLNEPVVGIPQEQPRP
jgi:hypothetical protein